MFCKKHDNIQVRQLLLNLNKLYIFIYLWNLSFLNPIHQIWIPSWIESNISVHKNYKTAQNLYVFRLSYFILVLFMLLFLISIFCFNLGWNHLLLFTGFHSFLIWISKIKYYLRRHYLKIHIWNHCFRFIFIHFQFIQYLQQFVWFHLLSNVLLNFSLYYEIFYFILAHLLYF